MSLYIPRTSYLTDRVRRNHRLRLNLTESALDIGVSSQTLRRMEQELGLFRPHNGLKPVSTSRYASWEGAHYMVINLCRTYCIVAKRSRNPKYEIAQKMAIQEIIYSAKGETLDQILALAKRWDMEYK